MQTEREYAVALFSLTAEENLTEDYLQHMKTIRTILAENQEYIEFLASPAIPLGERIASVDSSLAVDQDVKKAIDEGVDAEFKDEKGNYTKPLEEIEAIKKDMRLEQIKTV